MPSALVEPAFFHCPDYATTLGPEVGELATLAGLPPDPEQQLLLDGMFAFNKHGKSAAFEVCVICCRQNMKTGLMKMAALGKTLLLKRPLFVWSAHEFDTSAEAFRDLKIMIESTPDLDRMVKKVRSGSGSESIEWMGGQRIKFKARTKTGGRGLTGDDVGLDEAFALQPAHIGALMPTLSARPDPQVIYGSSAGLADSEVLRDVRDRGRSGRSPRLLYAEWCSPQDSCLDINCEHALATAGCALDDEDKLRQANPALHRRITIEFVRAERQAMPPKEFARERHGWWDAPDGNSAIPIDRWLARQDLESEIVGPPSFALDVSPKLTHSAIGVAGFRADQDLHTEIALREGERELDYRPGTNWVLPAFKDLRSRVPGLTVTIMKGSQAETLAPELEQAGIPVNRLSVSEVAAGCGLLYKLATDGGIWHPGQPELTNAVRAAQWRDVGEGAQAWGRTKSTDNITALFAATLAVIAATSKPVLDDVVIAFM